jgi:hypothetical protein
MSDTIYRQVSQDRSKQTGVNAILVLKCLKSVTHIFEDHYTHGILLRQSLTSKNYDPTYETT